VRWCRGTGRVRINIDVGKLNGDGLGDRMAGLRRRIRMRLDVNGIGVILGGDVSGLAGSKPGSIDVVHFDSLVS
jgi:hypothetical protein